MDLTSENLGMATKEQIITRYHETIIKSQNSMRDYSSSTYERNMACTYQIAAKNAIKELKTINEKIPDFLVGQDRLTIDCWS
jgi:hypothetical protein